MDDRLQEQRIGEPPNPHSRHGGNGYANEAKNEEPMATPNGAAYGKLNGECNDDITGECDVDTNGIPDVESNH